jgi:hypothetical protein
MPQQALSLAQRKEIFLALVKAQDRAMTVSQSRDAIAQRFGIDERQLRQIEQEGIDDEWPPL